MTAIGNVKARASSQIGLGSQQAGRSTARFAAVLLTVFLAGCGTSLDLARPALTADARSDAKPATLSESYRAGIEYFNRGEFGLAESRFREAVEKSPKDSNAWIGLAASYDRLRRFDLADRAYRSAIELDGETAQILNNQGYSYLLRGNLRAARAKFMKAHARDPENPTLMNNLKLLDGGAKFIKRDAL